MWFMNYIINRLNSISTWFYYIYLEVYGWPWPFWTAADLFLELCYVFSSLAWDFANVGEWVDATANRLLDILSYWDIWSHFESYFAAAINAWEWVRYAWSNVTDIIDDWWLATGLTVQSWIDTAKTFLQDQINSLTSWLTSLQAAWDDFEWKIPRLDRIWDWWANWWDNILRNVIAWGALTGSQIDSLIDSALKTWFPFYDQLAELWNSIAEFFTDPEDWLYKSLDRIIERFW